MMDPSKAGYDTGRHVRFTWSGAVRPLRSARPMLCRQFRPSPCPTHYGGRSATSPSADFCSITHGVATERAAPVVAGSGGDSAAFAEALSPAPMTSTATLGFDGVSVPFEPGLSSTPIAAQTAC